MERDGKVSGLERRSKRAGGEMFWASVSSTPLRCEGQEAFLTSLIDITEEKTAREELASNRRLLQTIFDALPISVLVKDASLRFIMVNRHSAARHGLNPADYPGRTTEKIIPLTEDAQRTTRELDQWVLDNAENLETSESRETYTDKEVQWHRVIRSPLVDEAGRVTGLVAIREDVTKQKQAAENLEESRALLQTIFDTIPVGLFVKDAEGRYLMTNRSFCEPLNLEPEDIRGKLPQEVWEQDEEESARRR